MKTPEELLQDLSALNDSAQDLRNGLSLLKKQMTDVESQLIANGLKRERIIEQLRVLRNSTVSLEISERQNEIERFRQILPDLMARIK